MVRCVIQWHYRPIHFWRWWCAHDHCHRMPAYWKTLLRMNCTIFHSKLTTPGSNKTGQQRTQHEYRWQLYDDCFETVSFQGTVKLHDPQDRLTSQHVISSCGVILSVTFTVLHLLRLKNIRQEYERKLPGFLLQCYVASCTVSLTDCRNVSAEKEVIFKK
jgi:hypothetical protein